MSVSPRPALQEADRGARAERRWLVWTGFLLLLGFCLFFLVRPFLDGPPAYRPRPPGTTYAYSFVVVGAFLPYAAALWAARMGIRLRWALVGTAALHLVLLPAALTQSQDVYAYLFYGKMWAVHGANPYVDLPLRFASDPWFPWLRWPDQVSVYGPLWTLVTGGVARLVPGSLLGAYLVVKAAVAGAGVLAVWGVVRAARDRGKNPGLALVLLTWNPVVLVSAPLGGHADVAVAAALLWAMAADRRGRPIVASLLLAGAALVKAYAVLVLLVYMVALARRRGPWIRAVGAAGALAVLAYVPFWQGPRTLSGVTGIARQTSASLGGGLELLLGEAVGADAASWVVRAVAAAVVLVVIVVVARRSEFPSDPWPGATAAFLAYVAVTPWFLYWHLLGVLALAAVAASKPVRAAAYAFSGTSMLTASFGATGWGRVIQTALRYGIPAAAFARARRH